MQGGIEHIVHVFEKLDEGRSIKFRPSSKKKFDYKRSAIANNNNNNNKKEFNICV